MPEVHITAIFTPRPGKVRRVRELLATQCREVYEKENYALRFMVTEQLDTEIPEFVLFETYTSKDDTDRHLKEPHFLAMSKTLADEGLLTKSPYVAKTTTTAGFDLDRKFIT